MAVEKLSEVTHAVDLLMLSVADRFSILIPSFLRIGHFAMECFFSKAKLWQITHFSAVSERLFRQHERW
jgi:hypothetical protein